MKLSSMKLNERNPRTISKSAFEKLCESVKRFPKMMAVRGIVVDDDDIVIGGTQRYRACVANGMTEVPESWVSYAKNFTPEERKRFIVADNAPDGMAGDWDMDALANEWSIEDLISAGFDPADLPSMEDAEDDAPPDAPECEKTECPKCGFKW